MLLTTLEFKDYCNFTQSDRQLNCHVTYGYMKAAHSFYGAYQFFYKITYCTTIHLYLEFSTVYNIHSQYRFSHGILLTSGIKICGRNS